MKKKLLILILFTATIQAMVLDSMHMKIYAECSAYGNLVDKYQTRNFLVEISNQNISWYEKENIYSLPSDSGEFQILKDDNSPHYMEFDKFTDGTYDKKPYYSINQSKGL